MKKSTGMLLTLAGGLLAMTSAQAADCILRGGVHNVDPKSKNNGTVHVGSNATLSVNGACFVTPNVAIDVLGALPFKHDIYLNSNNAKVASTQQLPPTVSVQYHFSPAASFSPYIGAGLNYTLFFNKKTTGALAGTNLSLSNSFGIAAQVGADFKVGKDWVLGLDLRWADIDTKAKVNGASIGTVAIDPIVYGLTIGKRFSL